MKRRKSDSPQKAALRELMTEYLKRNDITVKNGTDVNDIMRDMMSIIRRFQELISCGLPATADPVIKSA